MHNKIESEYTRDLALVRTYNKKTYLKALVSCAIAVAVYCLVAYLRYDFSWAILIWIVVIQALMIFSYADIYQLIDLAWDDKESSLTFTYYNLVDKIVTEKFDKKDIEKLKMQEWRKQLVIDFVDNRRIRLNYSKNQELMLLNQRFDIKFNSR
ncbi:hypothetical protein [Mangrovibacterium diazotrophicum]|uniref:Uncharacterized protein n=1 Tax=Mangrovibacterium diazotrophicum TaxID=1261403 RepID=A0A419W412_9BACT|nr:hypothetical protein [Mangrovibacterium diazotrophicum]RKD90192.1 hypothetical protein BC643_0528 [Mangrovibacterium diazotrophicum]